MIDSEFLANLSENLHYLLDDTGTICDVAKRVGINRSELWRYMNFRAIPKTMTLIKLAEILEVTVDFLIKHHDFNGGKKCY